MYYSSADWLPDVNYCCWCIPLRCGSIIIALISLGIGGPGATAYFIYACTASVGLVGSILFYIHCVMAGLIVLTALMFLVGICAEAPITAEFFIWALFLTNVVTVILFIILGAVGLPTCLVMYFVGIAVMFVNGLIAVYFIIVVNSFKNTDM